MRNHHVRLVRTALAAIVGAALTGGGVDAQVQSRLTGNVTDATGAVIPGAVVTARNLDTGIENRVESGPGGAYVFPFLSPGPYAVSVESPGFKRFEQTGVIMETGIARTLDIELAVGEITETVTVEGAAPVLESETSTVGQFIERQTVKNMPVESRRAASLVRLTGMVVFSGEFGGEQVPRFSMAGGRSQNQMWQLDGGITQNMAIGIAQLSLNPPVESLQEFKVESSNYAAEFGRAGGGLIQMTTRSGTNEYHGAAYEFFRNDELDSRTFFAPEVAPLRFNVFGGSIGGPIRKDKTFFFFNYEGTRRRTGSTFSNIDVPNVPEVSGDFSNRANFTLIDPLTTEAFANNIIPASRVDPIGREFASLFPAPNSGVDITAAPRDNFVANTSDALTQDFYTARVDHHISGTDRVFGRFSWVRAPGTNDSIFPDRRVDSRANDTENRNVSVVGSWYHNFSPTIINEVRYMYMERKHVNRGAGTGSGLNGELGVGGVDPSAFARVTMTGLTQLGQDNHERIQDPIITHQFVDNITFIRGKHQIKTGFEYRFSRNKDDFNGQVGGRFGFTDRATGDGLASLLLGLTNSASLVDTDILNTRTDFYGAYVQDDWKVTSKLTVNLGVRWELDTPRWETNNRQSGFDLSAFNPVCQCPGAVVFSGRDGRGKHAHDFDLNNFGPRVGFAYRWNDKTVIRAGYGLSYLGAYFGAVPNTLNSGFSLNGSFTSPDGGFTPAFRLADGMPPIAREELDAGFGAVPTGQNPRLSPTLLLENHDNGYMQQWNLTIQRQFPFQMVGEIGYVANVGHKLGGPSVSLNMVPLVNGRGPETQSQFDRPFPQFDSVSLISPPWGNSNYQALNAKLEKRYSGGLNFLANYTWSRFIDDIEGSNELGGLAGDGLTHIELRRFDKALSGNHVAHRFVGSTVYELPWGTGRPNAIGNAVLNALAGGWGLGAIVEARTGSPFGVIEQTNRTNAFSSSQRPNLIAPLDKADNFRDNVLGQTFFDTSAFQAPGEGIFGNGPRSVCCGPGFLTVDLSAHKWFELHERFRLQFRADAFNAFNRANFANPSTLRGRGDFGRVGSVLAGSTGRQFQLSLRLEF